MKGGYNMNWLKELRAKHELTQQALSDKYGIPKRTIVSWEGEKRDCPEYVKVMLKRVIELDKEEE